MLGELGYVCMSQVMYGTQYWGFLIGTTHLSAINIQGHVVAIVSGHQVGPDTGSVSVVAIDSGGFNGPVRPKGEIEPGVSGTIWLRGADAHWPALLTQWMGTVVEHTYSRGKAMKRNHLEKTHLWNPCHYSTAESKVQMVNALRIMNK